jgi:hypothetical protein
MCLQDLYHYSLNRSRQRPLTFWAGTAEKAIEDGARTTTPKRRNRAPLMIMVMFYERKI